MTTNQETQQAIKEARGIIESKKPLRITKEYLIEYHDFSHSFLSENWEAITGQTPEQQRIQDLEQAILRFKTHLEELGGNYTQDELWKMINTATVDRPYYPPVSYHDDWSGKEVTNVKD